MLRGLKQFIPPFDADRFFEKKQLQVTNCSAWHDYESKELRGTRVEVVILVDSTEYLPDKNGNPIHNAYEKITVKIPKTVAIDVGTYVRLVNPKAVVFGSYSNQLSVTADDVEPLPVATKNGTKES